MPRPPDLVRRSVSFAFITKFSRYGEKPNKAKLGMFGLSEALVVTALATLADRLRSLDSMLGKAETIAVGVAALRSRLLRLLRPEGVRGVGVLAREELAVTLNESCLTPSKEGGTGVVARLRERIEPGFGLRTAATFLAFCWNADKNSAAAEGSRSSSRTVKRASDASCKVLIVEGCSGDCTLGVVGPETTAVDSGKDVRRSLAEREGASGSTFLLPSDSSIACPDSLSCIGEASLSDALGASANIPVVDDSAGASDNDAASAAIASLLMGCDPSGEGTAGDDCVDGNSDVDSVAAEFNDKEVLEPFAGSAVESVRFEVELTGKEG